MVKLKFVPKSPVFLNAEVESGRIEVGVRIIRIPILVLKSVSVT